MDSRLLAALRARTTLESVNAIAKGAGVGQSTLSRYLRGERKLSLVMASKLAGYLGLVLVEEPSSRKPSRAKRRSAR